MFLRIVRAAGPQCVEHEYVRVVEAYRGAVYFTREQAYEGKYEPPTPPTAGQKPHVVTNRHVGLRKINGLRGKMSNMG
jgi:hypothetical protein